MTTNHWTSLAFELYIDQIQSWVADESLSDTEHQYAYQQISIYSADNLYQGIQHGYGGFLFALIHDPLWPWPQ